MNAFKIYTTVNNSNQIVIENSPFKKGEVLEVIIVSENSDKSSKIKELKSLFQLTQEIIADKNITDDDIENEISNFRSKR